MELSWPLSHTHLNRTWTAPSLSHNPFPFPGDGSLILPLKSIMGFGECGTLDPMKSHPTECCQEASIHLQPQDCQAAMANPAGYRASSLWSSSVMVTELSSNPFKASCQELQGSELCIRWCKPPTPPSKLPWPIIALGAPPCAGGLFFLQRQEQNFLCSKAALQLQRNSSHFRYQEH